MDGRSTSADSSADPMLADDAWRSRQQAGIAALIGMATQMTLGMTESAAVPISPAWPRVVKEADRGSGDQGLLRDAPDFRSGLLGRLASLRADQLVRNSLLLILNSGIQAALGFTFWILMARLFSAGDVGKASSLISASGLVCFFALLGLNATLVRFLPTASDVSALITAAFLMVGGCAVIGSLAYVLLVPVVAPRLAFVAHQPALALGFILLSAAVTINSLTDSVFIAFRRAGFCVITDGVIGSLSKIVLGVILAGTGAYSLFAASVGGVAAAALVSLVLIITVLNWRPALRNPFPILRPLLKFSGANYIANAFNVLPVVVLPLIALGRLGAAPSAYYYVGFQIAYMGYAAIYAVEAAFFAEASQAGADVRAVRRRSRRLAVKLFVPGSIVLGLSAHWLLLVFGAKYSEHGTVSLELLLAATIPIAIYSWGATVLKFMGQLRALVFCNAVYAIGICGSAWVLASYGLSALSASWLTGSTAAAVVTTAAAALASRKARARHRKTKASEDAVSGPLGQRPGLRELTTPDAE